MKINWKRTVLAGVIGTVAFDVVGLLITGHWWDIPGLLGSKLGTGLAGGVAAHYTIGTVLAIIYAAVAPSLWGPKWLRAWTYITVQTILGVWLFMLPLLDMGVAGIQANPMLPFITLVRHWTFAIPLALLIPVDDAANLFHDPKLARRNATLAANALKS